MRAPRHGSRVPGNAVRERPRASAFPEFQWVLELVSSLFLRWWIVAVPSSSQVTSANDDDMGMDQYLLIPFLVG